MINIIISNWFHPNILLFCTVVQCAPNMARMFIFKFGHKFFSSNSNISSQLRADFDEILRGTEHLSIGHE